MFNLLVSGNGEWWEAPPLSIAVDRFKEYSGAESAAIDSARPDSLRQLEGIPTLLMYEVSAGGPHARIVRYGCLRNIVRRGRDLVFEFVPDPERPYLEQRTVFSLAAQLGMEPFEQHRTHWAVKDSAIPEALLATATAERMERSVRRVVAEYVEACRNGARREAVTLMHEIEQFDASLDKARLLLPARILDSPIAEMFPLIGIEPRTAEGRNALQTMLARHEVEVRPSQEWLFSFAWFVDLYGSRTEAHQLETTLQQCAARLVELGAMGGPHEISAEDVAHALWRTSRSQCLTNRLRRETAMLMDRLVRAQKPDGFWGILQDGEMMPSIRATAFAAVALQRLGDDRYHDAIRSAVDWLLDQRIKDVGAMPCTAGNNEPDVLATTLAMEAIRRSDVAEDIVHVLEAGDAWLISAQEPNGQWSATPLSEDFVTTLVLEYFERREEILPQVDGFLLMARDFCRKAVELQFEGGANNRRLAAIAIVHAVEMFLYGVFERRDDLGLSAFKENGTETLGPREALRVLQDALLRTGVLIAPQRLPHRDHLSSLIGKRDGIIHRAHEISEAELEEGIRHARGFITRFGRELLKLDLLQ